MPSLPRPTKRKYTQSKRNPTGDQKFYGSQRWKDVRIVHISYEPLCQIHKGAGVLIDCTEGAPIDHIIPVRKGGAELDFRNLMTLCRSCHDMKTGLERNKDLIEPFNAHFGYYYPSKAEKERLVTELSKYIR